MTQLDMFGHVAVVKAAAVKGAKKVVVLTNKLEWKFTKKSGFKFTGKKAQAALAL